DRLLDRIHRESTVRLVGRGEPVAPASPHPALVHGDRAGGVQAGDLEAARLCQRAKLGQVRRRVDGVRLKLTEAETLELVQQIRWAGLPLAVPTRRETKSMTLIHTRSIRAPGGLLSICARSARTRRRTTGSPLPFVEHHLDARGQHHPVAHRPSLDAYVIAEV